MKKNRIYIIIGIIFLLIGIAIIFWYLQSPKISNFKAYDETEKMEAAKKYGEEVVGWLRVEGTNIDLPLIRATANSNLQNSDYQFAWTSSFPDKKSNRPAFVSHNVRNVSANPIVHDDSMEQFEQLMSFIYPDFVSENQFIEYTNSFNETEIYRIYAVALVEDDQEASYSDTYTKKEQEDYIKKAKRESMYTMDVDVNADDLLLTLFTCTRFYGATNQYSFRVDARALRKNEKQTLNKVQKSKNYDKIENRMKEGEVNEKV